jgi:hypothetical protein
MEFVWLNGKPYVMNEDGELREASPYELEQEGYYD